MNSIISSEPKDYKTIKSEIFNLLKDIKNPDKTQNLYDHLQKLFDTKLLMKDEDKFLDLFEDISMRIKKDGNYFKESSYEETIKKYLESFTKNYSGKKKLLEPLVKVDGDDITPITQVGYVPEYYSLFSSFEWCGLSVSDKEAYLLTNSLRTLVNEKGLPEIRFWGKIYGRDKDYYIAEAKGAEGGGKF